MYVVFLSLFLAAQERLHHPLNTADRNEYCREAAASVGKAFGVEALVPKTAGALRRSYEEVLANRMQATRLGRATLEAMLGSQIEGVAGHELARRAEWLLDHRLIRGPVAARGA